MNLRLILFLITFCSFNLLSGQVFWTEDFDGSPCPTTSGCDPSFLGWTTTLTGANGATPNAWFSTCTENGNAAGQCGSGCGADQSLHVANIAGSTGSALCPTGDCGAAYDATSAAEITDKRCESPVINCTGQGSITVDFVYMEAGDGLIDNATFWYFDGIVWTMLLDMPKTPTGACAPQGQWTNVATINLPASADNNPNVQIGYRWVNTGPNTSATDPSFAVDDITLTNNLVVIGPTASFSSSDSTLCVGDCINFTDLSTGAPTGWSWSFPGATPPASGVQNPTNICYNAAGSFDVSLVADDGTNSDSLYMPNFITVNPPPTITANSSPGTTICAGDSITLTGGGGVSYTWDNGATNGVPFAPATTTTYTVTGTDANGCTNTAQITITVNSCSTVTAGFNTSATTICVGDSVIFTNASSSGVISWQWNFDFTGIGGATPPTASTAGPHTVFFNTIGTYTVQLLVSDGPAFDSITSTINVISCAAPTAGIMMDDLDGEICVNNCIDFSYDQGTGGLPTTLTWTFEGGTPATSSALNPGLICWNDTTGTFNVTLSVSNANGSSNTSTVVVVHEEPLVFAGNDSSITIGTNGYLNAWATDTAGNIITGGSYSWNPTVLLTDPNSQNTTVNQPASTGNYTVTYTDQYGCVVTDDMWLFVDIALNIGVPSAFSPNGDGSNDFLFVRGEIVIESMNFTIFNRYGQMVFETTDIEEGWDGTHNGVELNPGVFVYYVNVTFIDGSAGQIKGNVTLVR